MKFMFDILFKKLYIYPFLYWVVILLYNVSSAQWMGYLFHAWVIFYWIAMPIAFRTRFTIHSLGHWILFEIFVVGDFANADLDGMAGMAPMISFFIMLAMSLIGMLSLAVVSSIRIDISKTKNGADSESDSLSAEDIDRLNEEPPTV